MPLFRGRRRPLSFQWLRCSVFVPLHRHIHKWLHTRYVMTRICAQPKYRYQHLRLYHPKAGSYVGCLLRAKPLTNLFCSLVIGSARPRCSCPLKTRYKGPLRLLRRNWDPCLPCSSSANSVLAPQAYPSGVFFFIHALHESIFEQSSTGEPGQHQQPAQRQHRFLLSTEHISLSRPLL